jgi:O-antigen/teichoic acid export membrane protein
MLESGAVLEQERMGTKASSLALPGAPRALAPGARKTTSFNDHVVQMMAGLVLAQVLQTAAGPLLTRLFSPAAFGEVTTIATLAALLTIFYTGRYELVMVLSPSDEEALLIGRLALYLTGSWMILSVVAAGVLWGFSVTTPIGQGPLLFLLVLLAFLQAVTQIGRGWANRLRRYGPLATSTLLQQGGNALCSLAAGLLAAPHGLITGRILGQGMAAGHIIWRFAGKRLPRAHSSLIDVAKKYWQFPTYNVPYSFLASCGRDFIILAMTFAQEFVAVGFLGLARSITLLPTTFVSGSLSQVFFREAATGDRETVQRLARKLLFNMVTGFVPAFVVLAVFGPDLFQWAFGPGWRPAGEYAAILAVPGALSAVCSWPERLYEIAARQRASLTIQVCFDTTTALTVSFFLWKGWPPFAAVAAYACVNSAYHATFLTFAWRAAGFSSAGLLQAGGRAVAVGAAALAVCLALRLLPIAPLASAVAAAALAVGHIARVAWAMKRSASRWEAHSDHQTE